MVRNVAVVWCLALTAAAAPSRNGGDPPWPPERMPLPLAVGTADDLTFKVEAEQLYLAFNLVAGGKVAFDAGQFREAAERWDNALELPWLSRDLRALLGRWRDLARERAAGRASELAPGAVSNAPREPGGATDEPRDPPPRAPPPREVNVMGVVSGGGDRGPGGAVILLRRKDGKTPRPVAGRTRRSVQKNKRFIPHVMVVPVGTTIDFRNEDAVFHNVFSLSRTNGFDLPLYEGGEGRTQTFRKPGPVELLCNIHSAMQAWVYVADTPYYAQADGSGRFTVRGVPPGDYLMEVWHEMAAKSVQVPVRVTDGMGPVAVTVDGDRPRPAFVPDKSGKPRQPQLGY